VIVLVSDGEALSGSLKTAIGRCDQKGVTVTAVAVGSDNGGEVPGAQGIISRRDMSAMRLAAGLADASSSDGGFIDGNRRDAASALADQLRSLAPESEVSVNKKETKARWLLFTILAIAALGASKICLFNFSLKRSPVLFSMILTLFVCGCSGTSGKLLIIQGNFQNSQGRHSEAITAYLKALEHEEAAPYAEYGMGSVYYTMGEEKAALNRFSRALQLLDTLPPDINRELRYRIHYNTGVVLFGEGDFSGAAASFREALRTDGGKVEAKRNLELSVKSHTRRQASGDGNNPGQNEGRSESMVILTDYIKRKEHNQWRSRTWQEEETTGPDY
jgi:Ca-activated chloride channel family protein